MPNKNKKRTKSQSSPNSVTDTPAKRLTNNGTFSTPSYDPQTMNADQSTGQQTQQIGSVSPGLNGTFTMNPSYPYTPTYTNLNTNMNTSPTCSIIQPQQNQTYELLQNILGRLDTMDSKLTQLNSIQASIKTMTLRVDSMDEKIKAFEKSVEFLSNGYDNISTSTKTNTDKITKLQSDVSKLATENVNLKISNDKLNENIIDMKCRSMSLNMLFHGIPEGSAQIPTQYPNLSQSSVPAPSSNSTNF
jgi:hypothetical protein